MDSFSSTKLPTPLKPRQFVSQIEIDARDTMLEAVRKTVITKMLTSDSIIVNVRPMSAKMFERLRRGDSEFHNWSLRGAFSLAEAVRIKATVLVLQ
ncbi:hypothetical protein [Devosia sp. A449]